VLALRRLADVLDREGHEHTPDLELKTGRAKLWQTDENTHSAQVDCAEDSLVMIPTLLTKTGRQSIFGTTPDLFVRYSGVSSLLFWPADANVGGQTLDATLVASSNK
jgi:hypothetical protein